MACYWVVGAGSRHISPATLAAGITTPIFPFLVVGSAATKLTDYMRKLAPHTDNLVPSDVTATALRVGGVQEVVNRTADITAGTIRGGWGGFLASVATIMEYYQQTHAVLSKGGRALAAWPDPNKHVHPPSCEPIFKDLPTRADRDMLNNFISRLFRSSDYNIVTSKLCSFAYVMFASLLQYLQPMIEKYTVNHIVVQNLYEAAREFKIKKKTLARWGLAIDSDFRARNVMNVANTADLAPVVTKLQKELLVVKDQNAELKSMLTEIREHQVCTARDTCDKLSQLLSMITLQETGNSGVGAKRMRLNSAYLPSDTDAAAAAIPVHSSGSESAVLIMSTTPSNAFSMLQQAKAMVHFHCTISLSQLILKWYEKGFTTKNTPAQWTADARGLHVIVKVMEFVEKVWPAEASSVLQACPPLPSSPEYLHWNTACAAAATSASDAVANAIAAVDKTKLRDKRTVNAVYAKLQKNGLISTKKDGVKEDVV